MTFVCVTAEGESVRYEYPGFTGRFAGPPHLKIQ